MVNREYGFSIHGSRFMIYGFCLFTIHDLPFTVLMKLLLIGDVVGKPCLAALLDRLQDLKEQHAINFNVMNVETVAGGRSITAGIAELPFSSALCAMTSASDS